MLPFLVRRLIGAFLVLVAVSFITYLIFVKIPGGDPAPRIAGRLATDQNIADIRQKLHLNDPFYSQYWAMMQSLFTGTLKSYSSQLNVVSEIKRGIPATLSLTIGAGIIWLGFGILVGVISAVTAGGLSDRVITVLALIGISMPVFWLGLIARYLFAESHPFSFFPDGEYVPLTQNPWQWFVHLIMPWTVLAVLSIGFYGRVLRSNILDTINEDYVRTARARRCHRWERHPYGDRLQPQRRRAVRGRLRPEPRSPADHGRDDLRDVLHRPLQRGRRSLVRVARSADQADLVALPTPSTGARPASTRRAAASSVALGLTSPSAPCVLASLGARDPGIRQWSRQGH